MVDKNILNISSIITYSKIIVNQIVPILLLMGSLIFVGGYLFHSSYVQAQEDVIEEYQIKAVYLFNFTLFFTWPATVFNQEQQPFRLCILGQDPFGDNLDLAVENETVEGRQVTVERFRKLELSKHCQIVYISHSEQTRLTNILAFLQPYPILTVSDMDEFATSGGMIQFINTSTNEVRFAVAPETVAASGMMVSANLLEIATIVRQR